MVPASVSPVIGGDYGELRHEQESNGSNIAGISSGNVGILRWDDIEMVAMAAEGPLAVKDGRCSSIIMD